jgi:diacylglycerol O-acyltransferase / trehalose O-mycolyltransferase
MPSIRCLIPRSMHAMEMCASSFRTKPPSFALTIARPLGIVLMLLVLLAGCSAQDNATAPTVGISQTPTPSPPETASASSGTTQARVVNRMHVDGRMWDLLIYSPAVGREVYVRRLLLPARYETARGQRWPVLYLLHGCCDDYTSWTRSTDIEERTRNLDALVVMPDGGRTGFYSNWRSGPAWETFHVSELAEVLTDNYRARDRRVIAGLSMGGLGALDYAARNPGLFAVAASFSGIVHTQLSKDHSQHYLNLLSSEGEDPLALWGRSR